MKNVWPSLCLLAALTTISACTSEADCNTDADCGDSVCVAGACVVGEGEGEGEGEGCVYPDAPAVMTLGETLPAFSWSGGFTADGTETLVDLGTAPCGDDPLWSPFDTLVFVSIPAW